MEIGIFLTFCLQIPGLFILPAKPGLGVELNNAVFDQHISRPLRHGLWDRTEYYIEIFWIVWHPLQTIKYHIIPRQTLINILRLIYMVGKRFFYFIYSVSFVIYWDWEESALFFLGVINLHPANPEPEMLFLLLNRLNYNYSLLLPPIPISWVLSFFTVLSLIFHVGKLTLCQFFTNDRGDAHKCWILTFCFVSKSSVRILMSIINLYTCFYQS